MAQAALSLRPSGLSGSRLSYARRLELLTTLTQAIARGGEVRPLLDRIRQEVAEPLLLETLAYRRGKGQLRPWAGGPAGQRPEAQVWNAFLAGRDPATEADRKALLDPFQGHLDRLMRRVELAAQPGSRLNLASEASHLREALLLTLKSGTAVTAERSSARIDPKTGDLHLTLMKDWQPVEIVQKAPVRTDPVDLAFAAASVVGAALPVPGGPLGMAVATNAGEMTRGFLQGASVASVPDELDRRRRLRPEPRAPRPALEQDLRPARAEPEALPDPEEDENDLGRLPRPTMNL